MTRGMIVAGMLWLSMSCTPTPKPVAPVPPAPPPPEVEPATPVAPTLPKKPSASTIEIAGMGLASTEEQLVAKFGAEGMKCQASSHALSRGGLLGDLTYKTNVPIRECAVPCRRNRQRPADDGKQARRILIHDGRAYRVAFRTCGVDPISLATAAEAYATKTGSRVEILARSFSNGLFRDLDGFEVDLDRGRIIATINVEETDYPNKSPGERTLGLVEWADPAEEEAMNAEILKADVVEPSRAAAKKIDL
jgi:hypothetical protein